MYKFGQLAQNVDLGKLGMGWPMLWMACKRNGPSLAIWSSPHQIKLLTLVANWGWAAQHHSSTIAAQQQHCSTAALHHSCSTPGWLTMGCSGAALFHAEIGECVQTQFYIVISRIMFSDLWGWFPKGFLWKALFLRMCAHKKNPTPPPHFCYLFIFRNHKW